MKHEQKLLVKKKKRKKEQLSVTLSLKRWLCCFLRLIPITTVPTVAAVLVVAFVASSIASSTISLLWRREELPESEN